MLYPYYSSLYSLITSPLGLNPISLTISKTSIHHGQCLHHISYSLHSPLIIRLSLPHKLNSQPIIPVLLSLFSFIFTMYRDSTLSSSLNVYTPIHRSIYLSLYSQLGEPRISPFLLNTCSYHSVILSPFSILYSASIKKI